MCDSVCVRKRGRERPSKRLPLGVFKFRNCAINIINQEKKLINQADEKPERTEKGRGVDIGVVCVCV